MNCVRCGTPLEKNARFCRKCGTPVVTASPDNVVAPSSSPQVPFPPPSPPSPSSSPPSPARKTPSAEDTMLALPSESQQPPARPAPKQPWTPPTRPGGSQQQGTQQPWILPGQPAQQVGPQGPQAWNPAQQGFPQSQSAPYTPQPWEATKIVPPHTLHTPQSAQPASPPPQPNVSPVQSPSPFSYYQPNKLNTGAKMPPAVVNTPLASRRRRGSCLWGGLTTLVLLLVIAGAGWIFALRPYLHNIAEMQVDQAMSTAVKQIPAQISQLPPGPLPVTENVANNLLALNVAPSDPVQHPVMHITPNGVSFDFQIYGYSSTITGVPKAVDGQLTATNVTVQGIAALIMSPDDITALLNKHLKDAQARLGHSIQDVMLRDQEMDLILT